MSASAQTPARAVLSLAELLSDPKVSEALADRKSAADSTAIITPTSIRIETPANGNGGANCGTLSSGTYGIAANWKASLGNTGISESLTCVGPVNLTVTQNKIFNFNTVN